MPPCGHMPSSTALVAMCGDTRRSSCGQPRKRFRGAVRANSAQRNTTRRPSVGRRPSCRAGEVAGSGRHASMCQMPVVGGHRWGHSYEFRGHRFCSEAGQRQGAADDHELSDGRAPFCLRASRYGRGIDAIHKMRPVGPPVRSRGIDTGTPGEQYRNSL
jgi:hypothetical protein